MQHNRRAFLRQSALLGATLALPGTSGIFAGTPDFATADPVDPAVVKEYVGKAHNDLDRVREILDEHPLILNAAWDWGDGDFETALGAAGHVGFRDMAQFLLDKGARADLFVLTMLGETAIVKALVERYPALLTSIGPHGFTLLHHARRGGEQAQDLLDFFTEKGLTETYIDIFGKKKK